MLTRRLMLQQAFAAATAAGTPFNWGAVHNPVIDLKPRAVRDPAAIFHNGQLHCFCTIVEPAAPGYRLFVDVTTTADLVHWTPFRRIAASALNYSSPGNVFRAGGKWRLCVQSYPIDPGQAFGNETARLWLMESEDLESWSAPVLMRAEGCTTKWSKSHRQIDPYIVEHQGRYWCFYKASGCLGVMVSPDLRHWEEASLDRPVLGPATTPDGCTVENPCVVRDGQQFRLVFAPCRKGRGIGVATSDDLLNWHDVHYLNFPGLAWAPDGPTAAQVLDLRETHGRWLMLFHGERDGDPHSAALGVAWSRDFVHWECA